MFYYQRIDNRVQTVLTLNSAIQGSVVRAVHPPRAGEKNAYLELLLRPLLAQGPNFSANATQRLPHASARRQAIYAENWRNSP